MASITSPSGRVYQWNKSTPPTESDIAALVDADSAQQPTQQSGVRNDPMLPIVVEGMSVGEMPLSQHLNQGATAIRYGGPAVVGLAAAPFTGGMSALAAAATMSGAGAGFGAIGSTIAQLMEVASGERQELSGRGIMSDTALAATPMKVTGGAMGRFLANVPSAIATSEISRWLELGNDKYSPKPKDTGEAVSRFLMPAAITGTLSLVGGKGATVAEGVSRADEIKKARMGGGVTLSDVFPSFVAKNGVITPNSVARLEAGQLERGSELAHNALQSMDVNITEEVARAFPSAKNNADLASDLYKHVNSLTRLQDEAVKAEGAARNAAILAQDAKMNLAADMPALETKAKEAALEATKSKLLYKAGVNTIFGFNAPDITAVAQGRRIENVAALATAAKDATKSAIGELYAKAGVGVNEPVASLNGVLANIDSMAGAGGRLEGNIARDDVKKAIIRAFPQPEPAPAVLDYLGRPMATPTADTTISLEGYRNLRDKIAANLVKDGEDPKAANRIAGAAYAAVRDASDTFVSNTRPGTFTSWKTAQAAAASEFKARETNAMGMLADGKADELYDKILKEGAGPVIAEIKAYQGVLASTFDRTNPNGAGEALKASQLFGDGVNKLIRDAAIDRSINRGIGLNRDFRNVNFAKLTEELQSLASRGFDPAGLGLGSKEQIASIARVSASAKNGGYTVAELDQLLKELPGIGVDAAGARIDYQRAVRDEMLSSGAVARKDATMRISDAAGKAKLDSDKIQAAYDKAAKDPLVQLLNRTDMKLSKDVVDNIHWVDRLLTVGPEAAADFADALIKNGRGTELTKIREAAVATVMRRFKPVGSGPQKLNLQNISDFFFSGNKDSEIGSETLRAIMGSSEYNNLLGKYGKPIKDILATQKLLQQSDSAVREIINPSAIRLRGSVGGVAANIPILREIIGLEQAGRYKTLYTLYIDPKWAPRFAAAGSNIDKFVANNPVNATVLKLAMSQDDEANANRKP